MTARTKGLILAGITVSVVAAYAARRRRFSGIKLKKAIVIHRPLRDLYLFWRDFENLPRITEFLESVQVLGDVHSRWTVKTPGNIPLHWDAEITTDRREEMIGWRSSTHSLIETAGYVRFEPLRGNRGTRVRVALEYYPPAGRIGAALAAAFGKRPESHLTDLLRRLKQLMEGSDFAANRKAEIERNTLRGDDAPRYLAR